jgi:hypothetical protein
LTTARGRLTISSVVRSAASLRLARPGLLVTAVAAAAMLLIDEFAPTAWFVTSMVAIASIETVLFATWLTPRRNAFGEVLTFSAGRVLWIGVLVLIRSALGGAALIPIGLLAVVLAGGADPVLMLYLGFLVLVAVAVVGFVGRLICAGPIVVALDVRTPGAIRRSWVATGDSTVPVAVLQFALYVLSIGLQGYLGLLGIVGLVLALVVGAVLSAAVQAGAYRELFSG